MPSFLFMGLFVSSSVRIFVTTMLCCCLDFWITKNVTGRLLIGLRWWSGSDLTENDVVGPKDPEEREEEDRDVKIALRNIDLTKEEQQLKKSKEKVENLDQDLTSGAKSIKDHIMDEVTDAVKKSGKNFIADQIKNCLLYTSPSPRDRG